MTFLRIKMLANAHMLAPRTTAIKSDDSKKDKKSTKPDSYADDSPVEQSFEESSFIGDSHKEGPDRETLALIENYEEEELEYAEKLEPMEFDEDPHRGIDNFRFKTMFSKFNGKEIAHKKVKTVPKNKVIAFVKKEENFEQRSTRNKSASVKESGDQTRLHEQSPGLNQNTGEIESPVRNEQVESESSPSAFDLESIIEKYGDNQQSEPLKKSEEEDLRRKASTLSDNTVNPLQEKDNDQDRRSTIRVLSKSDMEKSVTFSSLRLETALAKNKNKDEEKEKSLESGKRIEEPDTNEFVETASPTRPKNHDTIAMPEDPLDVFETQDKQALEVDTEVDMNECCVVTRNPLVSSYKLKITDVATCQILTRYFCDASETVKKAYESTVIKVRS